MIYRIAYMIGLCLTGKCYNGSITKENNRSMLYLEKDPALCASSTPFPMVRGIIRNFIIAWKEVCGAGNETLLQKTLPYCISKDLEYSLANVKWYETYINELISICNSLKPNKLQQQPILLHPNNVQHKMNGFNTNPLKIHSPMFNDDYIDIIEENKPKFNKAQKDIIALSRLILIDMHPQFEDFPRGVPAWLSEVSPKELVSAYDMVNRRHIKIEKDGNRLRYYTSIISNNWKEIEDVPREMDILVGYLISNRANLTLVD